MAMSIAAARLRLKQDVQRFLSVPFLTLLAAELGLVFKPTLLAVPQLVALFARQILAGNVSMPELARIAGSRFTPEAYCIARGRLPLELLQTLLERVWAVTQGPAAAAVSRWKGHRLWHLDGSSFSMPDTPALQQRFGQPGQQRKGCGFPVAHILCLFDAATGLIGKCIVTPLRTHDMAHAAAMHAALSPGDILIADRAFESFAHLALLLGRALHAILPVHQMRKVDFVRRERRTGKRLRRIERQRLRRGGRCDQVVRWTKPLQKPRWMSWQDYDALPATIDVREIKREVTLPSGRRASIVVITTLLDAQAYPAQEIVAVLKDRWQIEVNLRHLKTTMNMEILRSQSAEGIEKELLMFLIVYNLVRLIMLEAAQAQQVSPGQISFADALYWVRHGDLAGTLPRLQVLPRRPGRIEPRVVKRRSTKYRLLRKPRKVLQKQLRRGK
jgi:hypothetical protein